MGNPHKEPRDKDLPQELIDELSETLDENREYTLHDFVLAYINAHEDVSIDELIIYLFKVNGRVTSRNYLYQILFRLRNRGLIRSETPQDSSKSTHYATALGAKKARPCPELKHA